MVNGWASLIVMTASAVAADPPRHEPIHSPERVFTAQEFRERLRLRQGEKAVLDLFSKSGLSDDSKKKLLEFAQRLQQKQTQQEGKKDLPIPPDLLKNQEVTKLLENEKFLDWLAQNERIQKMAERMAEQWKLPYQAPPASIKEGVGPFNDFLPPNGNPPLAPDPNRPGSGTDPRNSSDNTGTMPDPPSGSEAPIPGATPPSPPPPPPKLPLERLTDQLRQFAPMAESPTLDRVDEMLNGSAPPPPADAPPASPPNDSPSLVPSIPEAEPFEWWKVIPGMEDSPTPLSEIPLPPGLDRWAPSLDAIPLPAVPLPNIPIPDLSSIPIPSFPTSFDPSVSPTSLAWPLVIIGFAVLFAAAIRMLWSSRSLAASAAERRFFAQLRPPSDPFEPTRRDSIRQWFEYLAFKALGPSAVAMSHAQWRDALKDEQAAWPDLYAQARYLPPEEPIDENLLASASMEYRRLTGHSTG